MKEGRFEWMDKSACTPEDDHLFFPFEGERPSEERWDEAKAICDTCQVVQECREYRDGLKPRPNFGVWGGKAYMPRVRVSSPGDEAAPDV